MSESTLYLKYRPVTFNDLVGQEIVTTALQNALRTGNTAHAYLFTGSRGTGKTSSARILAKALLCEKPLPDGNPCNTCSTCVAATEGRLTDIIEIDAASNNSVEDIRSLIETLPYQPTFARAKVYILDEVHMLSKGAFNAFLKSLEEPPAHVYFILATTEVDKLPETIISRCQRYDFRRITEVDIAARLQHIADSEQMQVAEGVLPLLARLASGGLRDAIGLLEKLWRGNALGSADAARAALGILGSDGINNYLAEVRSGNAPAANTVIRQAYAQGLDLQQFLRDILDTLQEELYTSGSPAVATLAGIYMDAVRQLRVSPLPTLPLYIATARAAGGDAPAAATPTAAPAPRPAPASPAPSTPAATSPAAPAATPVADKPKPGNAPAASAAFASPSAPVVQQNNTADTPTQSQQSPIAPVASTHIIEQEISTTITVVDTPTATIAIAEQHETITTAHATVELTTTDQASTAKPGKMPPALLPEHRVVQPVTLHMPQLPQPHTLAIGSQQARPAAQPVAAAPVPRPGAASAAAMPRPMAAPMQQPATAPRPAPIALQPASQPTAAKQPDPAHDLMGTIDDLFA